MNHKAFKYPILIIFIIIFYSISSCYKHEEGCRNPNAENFDVTADKDCEEECCTFPTVNLDFKLILDTITIDTTTKIPTQFGDTVNIKFMRMYLSEFNLINDKDKEHILQKEITIGSKENDEIYFQKINYTITKIKQNPSSFEIGTLDTLSIFKKVNFNFGIISAVNHSNMDEISKSSPLYSTTDNMYANVDTGFYFLKLTIAVNNTERDFHIYGDNNYMNMTVIGDIDFTKREEHDLLMAIDIDKLFFDINFKDGTENDITTQLLENLENSFIIREK